jgi:signal transduction histidine kinase
MDSSARIEQPGIDEIRAQIAALTAQIARLDCEQARQLQGDIAALTAALPAGARATVLSLPDFFSRSLIEIQRAIHATLDFDSVMQGALGAATEALGSDTAAISLRRGSRWKVGYVHGFPASVVGLEMNDDQERHAILAAQTMQPVAIADTATDPRVNNAHLLSWGIHSVLVVPVILREQSIGVMFFNYQRHPLAFRQEHIEFAVNLATSISLALENARLYEQLEQEMRERTQAVRELRESEERFRAVTAAAQLLVYACDSDLRYTWIYNPLRGYKTDDVLGKRDDEILGVEAAAKLTAAKLHALETGESTVQEVIIPLKDETTHYILASEPMHDSQGQVCGLTCAAIDITPLRKLESEHQEDQLKVEVQRRLLQQREKERQEIARDIHDGPIQSLVALLFGIQTASRHTEDEAVKQELALLSASVQDAIQELREMINDLRPPFIIRFGLARAIRSHVEDVRRRSPRLAIALELAEDNQGELSENTCLGLFRIFQEALNNIGRHSGASWASVRFTLEGERAGLEIEDNGQGFQMSTGLSELMQHGHFGMAGMKERAESLGGAIRVYSSPGSGTRIEVNVPLSS